MNVHVPAYNHELMEGVPHSCIFKRRCSYFERDIKIDMHNDGGKMSQRYTRLFRIDRGLST